MINSKILYDNLIRDLKLDEPGDEISAIAFEVLDHHGVTKTEILSQKFIEFSYERLLPLVARLNNHEPVQYVLGSAWFCGNKFIVNSSVLIPRPETELIIEEALKIEFPKNNFSILDIGTGSGCIAITLALAFPQAQITAVDVSEDALSTAQQNASNLNVTTIDFKKIDILRDELLNQSFDLIVSNPPYIASTEMKSIPKNVVDYEPHIALFAHGHDPLIFYRTISQVAAERLNTGGKVIIEINEKFGKEIVTIFKNWGLKSSKIIRDFANRDRIIIAKQST